MKGENKSVSEVPEFCVNFLCIVCHGAIRILQIFIGGRWPPPLCSLKRQAGGGAGEWGGFECTGGGVE